VVSKYRGKNKDLSNSNMSPEEERMSTMKCPFSYHLQWSDIMVSVAISNQCRRGAYLMKSRIVLCFFIDFTVKRTHGDRPPRCLSDPAPACRQAPWGNPHKLENPTPKVYSSFIVLFSSSERTYGEVERKCRGELKFCWRCLCIL